MFQCRVNNYIDLKKRPLSLSQTDTSFLFLCIDYNNFDQLSLTSVRSYGSLNPIYATVLIQFNSERIFLFIRAFALWFENLKYDLMVLTAVHRRECKWEHKLINQINERLRHTI